jgi:ABC-type oligopeptide transport system ATPase subunit
VALVEVRHLSKSYARNDGVFGRATVTHAVRDVSFTVESGETLGLVGESGSGKTTTARCVLRLVEPTSGEVTFRGESVLSASASRMRELRRQMQIVFQDPWDSLNPRMCIADIVGEPLDIHHIGAKADRRGRVEALLSMVGLDPGRAGELPGAFSGGQRQRVALARAIALEPALVVADEPVSSLDVSVQAQVLNLLVELQERLGLAYLLIAHDLRLVEHVCHRVAVMHRGRIVEAGQTTAVFGTPAHPYTRALLSAVPRLDAHASRRRIVFDPASAPPDAPLRQVGNDHWAAID